MLDATCAVRGCDRPSVARGWCRAHWGRWRRLGDVRAEVPLRRKAPNVEPGTLCTVEGCQRAHFAREFCHSHYSRWARHGEDAERTPTTIFAPKGVPCQSGDCADVAIRCGFCWKHYYRMIRHGRLDLPVADLQARKDARRRYEREWKRAEYAREPERGRARARAMRAANPERTKLSDAKKRRRRRSAPRIPFTVDALAQKISYWGGRCWICDAPWQAIDHVKPISKGGWDVLSNLRPICTSCNSKKHNKWPYPIVG